MISLLIVKYGIDHKKKLVQMNSVIFFTELRRFCRAICSTNNSFISLSSVGGILHKKHFWLGTTGFLMFLFIMIIFAIGVSLSFYKHKNSLPIIILMAGIILIFLETLTIHNFYFAMGSFTAIMATSFLNDYYLARKAEA